MWLCEEDGSRPSVDFNETDIESEFSLKSTGELDLEEESSGKPEDACWDLNPDDTFFANYALLHFETVLTLLGPAYFGISGIPPYISLDWMGLGYQFFWKLLA